MIINVTNILKTLSRFRRATLPLTILLVFSVSLSTPAIYAASAASVFSMKIGPLLRKTIEEANKAPVDQQAGKRVLLSDQIPGQLHKVIVVINRDHLKPLPPDLIEELRNKVELLGGHIGNHAYNNVQVWIPLDKIENLIEWTEIIRIDEPLIPQTNSINSEGTGLIGATSANNRGLKGKGVKVGVIDLGFKGYTSLLGTELPTSVTTKVMGTDAAFTSNVHGTACAEIVHDVAPEAELFLVNVTDLDVGFHNAVDWLQSQGVHVISSSIGINTKTFVSSMYLALKYNIPQYASDAMLYQEQMKSQWDNTINNVVSNGVTWTQAAGNDGEKKWIGPFSDSDNNNFLNFSPSENWNEIDVKTASAGDDLYILMMWDLAHAGATYDDYDLLILDDYGNTACSSTIIQSIFPFGMEACAFQVDSNRKYFASVYRYQGKSQEIILLLGHDNFPNFKINTPQGTVKQGPPAHNANVITVGAVSYNSPNIIEPYSSQGPNADGIIKPDLVAPDCVSAASWSGPFCGTSAAAPHVAGLSALVKQAYPAWSPSQIKSYLEANALDSGASGKDNVFGSGLVQLPPSLYESPTYSLSPGANGFSAASAMGVITVTPSSSSVSWTAVSNASWITITSGSSYTGSGTVNYSVAANTTGSTRTGTMTVAGSTITVTQTGFNAALYFPHVATNFPWQTEIAIINTSPDQTVTGTLRALSDKGQLIATKDVTLSVRGRRQITVADEFTNHEDIGYIILDTNSAAVQGYTKLYQAGSHRAAIPAVKEVNTSDIYIPHIAATTDWWTVVTLVNTTSATKELTITFNNGESFSYPLKANEHKVFDIAKEFFNNQPRPDIQSAVISHASGVIGLELFGSKGWGPQLDGILLTDKTTSTIYYPHVASDDYWWTGIVAYNPSSLPCTITITPYSADGTPLTPLTPPPIAGKGKYIGEVADLALPAQTAWFRIDSTSPINGFELFATRNGNLLAAYAEKSGTGAKAGIFPKIEKDGWTGIAFVNMEDSAASVTLTAYNDSGTAVATQGLPVPGHAKVVNNPQPIFSQDISSATYITYSSDKSVIGFQLNASSDGMMLDALPGLVGEATAISTYSISGTIRSGSNSGPVLSGATVSIAGKTAITGGTGTFSITGIPAGTYAFSVSKSGYVTYTNPAFYVGSNQTGQNFYLTAASTSLVCPESTGVSVNGIQFYGSTSYQLSTTAANVTGTTTLTWGAYYQNIYYLPAGSYSGSLRAQLWAIPYSFSGGTITNSYGLGIFNPNFTGAGARSASQLYVGYYTTGSPISSSVTVQNPPAGTYCMVATINEYNPAACSDPSGYCYNQWVQFSGPVTFH